MTQYRTFWRRFFAGFVDGLVLVPLAIMLAIVQPEHRGPYVAMAWIAFQTVVIVSYNALMLARYGQTFGKMALSVIVLNVGEDRIPTLKQAVLRDLGNIIPAMLILGFMAGPVLSGDSELTADQFSSFKGLLTFTQGGWFWIEVLTMLTNGKRRALHDFLAGTVVMRKDSVPVGVLDAIR